jgi:hypothetical protein
MFAVLLRFTFSFVYKVYIGFLSRMRDWTVAAARYNTVNLLVKVQYIKKYGFYNNLNMFTYLTMIFNQSIEYFFVSSQINEIVSGNRHMLIVEVTLIAIRKAENVWSNRFFRASAGFL